MKAIIIEDEIIAAKRLQKMVSEIDSDIEVSKVLESVLDAVNYLSENNPSLIFMDVQLADGTCFEIFEQLEIDAPIIFTTAYNDYMQKAFQVNSVDYLLKPIHPDDLEKSISKFKKYQFRNGNADNYRVQQLLQQITGEKKLYKGRFLVKTGRCYVSLNVNEVAYIVSENKLSFLVDHSGKRYVVDYTLDRLEQLLDPLDFCKINRNYIVSHHSVTKIEPYFNNRMLLYLDPSPEHEVLVSRSYLAKFRIWVDR